jgi:hypothetical protein
MDAFALKPEFITHPMITHGKMAKLIVALAETPPNADIEYKCGYMDGVEFKNLGMAHYHIEDHAAVTEMQDDPLNPGQQIEVELEAARPELTEFMTAVNAANNTEQATYDFLVAKIGA